MAMNMVDRVGRGEVMDINYNVINDQLRVAGVSLDAEIGAPLNIGRMVTVGNNAEIGDFCSLEDDSFVGNRTRVGDFVNLGKGAAVERDGTIFANVSIGKEAHLGHSSIIGGGVVIPPEFLTGPDVVVPSNRTIADIGVLGTSKRFVTIHGSDDGPRYSIGCQYSVSWPTIKFRIENGVDTTPASAASYQAHLEAFNLIGKSVQEMYDRSGEEIEELREAARDLRI